MDGVTDIIERLEAFAARHYHVERGGMARDAAREIVKWKTAYLAAIKVGGELEREKAELDRALDGARGCLKETEAEVVRLRDSVRSWQDEAIKLAGLLQQSTHQWQPIETAPQGKILILNEDGATFGIFDTYCGEWRTGDDFHYRFHPTHWMPLPEPPK